MHRADASSRATRPRGSVPAAAAPSQPRQVRVIVNVPPFAFVIVHASLGDLDQAFAWLERSMAERDSLTFWLPVVPAFDSLRSDPRHAHPLRRLGV